MEDRSLSDQLSQLFPPQNSDAPAADGEADVAQRGLLVNSLQAFAGQAGGALPSAINEFLSGQGELHEATRAASASGSSALDKVISLLTTNLKLSPTIARIIAPILLKLAPSIAQQPAKETVEKAKPRRKTKPKTSSSTRKETSSKKTGKKTAAKPRKTTAKSTAKKKTTAKSTPKESTAAKKRKTAKREVEVNLE